MSIIKKLKEWNWRRNFATKKFKLYLRYQPLIILDRLFAREKPQETHPIKNILLIRNDVIGDMIVSTGLIRKLAQAGYNVYVSSGKSALDIIRNNPYVCGTFLYDSSSLSRFIRSIRKIRQHHFDLSVELRVSREISLYDSLYHGLIHTDILLGFNKPFLHTFNASINCDVSNIHVTEPFKLLLEYLHLDSLYLDYELFIDADTEHYILPYLPKQKFAVLNPFGSKEKRCLSEQQIQAICYNLEQQGFATILVGSPDKINKIKIDKSTTFPSRDILDVIALIKYSDLVVTVDTSVIHAAAAFTKNTIGLYLDTQHPLAECSQINKGLKYKLNMDFFRYRAKICYGLSKSSNDVLHNFFTVNNIFWAPNNPNAVQLFFPEEEISLVPIEELSLQINHALHIINDLK
ncbi:glycosyltransferase family 9 protein [Eikenella sp. S3360]|uniref:Glycosyltransferase family 9 protein n=1 Tax=Eikenella glucosivorans TaxID=2766967 RepID=A0ABS0N8F1_9NEIS|nr:glycosyltransferase family 9 protein [Eikenella glucosivorans]MBH5328581.1 glycosyltransferase family 9 protein [Eikenella glucosivorans]